MFKKTIPIIFLSLCFMLIASGVQALNLSDAFGDPLAKTSSEAGYNTDQTGVNPIIQTIIQVALSFLGVIFLILMIYGGILWMTASGNEEQVEKAKKLLRSAIIGLIIVLAAYAISWFVVSTLGEETLQESSGGESEGSGSSAIIRLYS